MAQSNVNNTFAMALENSPVSETARVVSTIVSMIAFGTILAFLGWYSS
jgi:purine-cytosine permease-like protein